VICPSGRLAAGHQPSGSGKLKVANARGSRIYIGKGGKIDRLKELAEKNPASSKTLSYLARAYGVFEQHLPSAETFMRASAKAENAERQAGYLQAAAKQFGLAKQSEKTSNVLKDLRTLAHQTASAEKRLLNALIDLAEQENSIDLELALLERLIELKPDDYVIRFNLAFKHSEQGNDELAVYHYSMIPYPERSPIAWNNFGASLDQLKLPGRENDIIRFSGSYQSTNPFAMTGLLSGIATNSSAKYNATYSGVLRGRGIFGTVVREREGATLMESAGANSKV
jgi:tetratricopeptide (TPR) repeat protein